MLTVESKTSDGMFSACMQDALSSIMHFLMQAYAYVAIITFLVLLSCGSCVHESRADLDDAANQLRKLLLQEIMINDAHNAQEDTGKLQYSYSQ